MFPAIYLCQLCLAECVSFSRGDDKICIPPAKNSPNLPDKTGRKKRLKAKSLGSFLRLWGDFAGKNSGAEIEGNRLNWLMCQENIGGRKVEKIKGFDENWPKICSENNSVI